MGHVIRGFNGMENQDGMYWPPSAAAPALSQLQASNGLWSWRYAPGGSWGNRKVRAWDLASGNGDTGASWNWGAYNWVMFDLYIDTLPGGGQYCELFISNNGGAKQAALRIDSAGKIQVYGITSGWGTLSTAGLPTGQWVQVSFKHYKVAGAGNVQAIVRSKVSGSELANVTATPNADAGTLCYIGSDSTAANYGVFYFDNAVISCDNNPLDDPYLLLGLAYGEVYVRPTGNGIYNSGFTGDWTDVDEVYTDSDGSYRETVYSTGNITHTVQDCEAQAFQPILAVHALINFAWQRKSSGGGTNYKLMLISGGSFFLASSYMTEMVAYNNDCAYIYRLDPVDSQAWTPTRVKVAECGVNCDYSNGARRVSTSDISTLVTFDTSPAPGQRLLHYTLDLNGPGQPIFDQNERVVPPEELRPNTWLAIVGWANPTPTAYSDFVNDPEKVPITVVTFTEPDTYTLGTGEDDLLNAVIARLTQRSA